MPLEIESCNEDRVFRRNECESTIFETRDEMNRSLSRFCHGNLYVIGNIWVRAVKSVLVGSKMCLVPTVQAAPPKGPPQKPPKTRYKELPLYEGPYHEYHKHEEFKDRCKDYNVKILHSQLLPYVKNYRKDVQEAICLTIAFIKELYIDVSKDFETQKKKFKAYMRDPDNLVYRRILFATATTAGFYYGIKRKGLLTRAIFWGSIGALASGFLCFPKETDENFRELSFQATQVVLCLFNAWCNQGVGLTVGPCLKDRPPIPPKRKVDKKYECPPK